MQADRARAFAPGRANLIGEHTDYNGGLALPFAIREGCAVDAARLPPPREGSPQIVAVAHDLGEIDEFPLAGIERAEGWRAFVRGVVAELAAAGHPPPPARIEIHSEVPWGVGLSSSAALEVALALALLALAPGRPGELGRLELAQLCSRVENKWVGAETGLLDQLAALYGQEGRALLIDFGRLSIEPVPLELDGWSLWVLDSGERHANAGSGYNTRRAECAQACGLLGVESVSEASEDDVADLPEPLRSRAAHVLTENRRVRQTAAALQGGDLPEVGRLLDESHASLRDLYAISTPAVEHAAAAMRAAGAAGARVMGGGFGGAVLGLFPPGYSPPPAAREVRPGAAARVLQA